MPVAATAPAPVVQVVDDSELAAARATIDELRTRLADRPATEKVERSTLTVTGVARIPSAPDVLRLSVGVAVTRPTVKESINAANDAAGRVLGALKGNGVEGKDIQTAFVNVHEHWSPNGTRDGYTASNTVTAKVRDVGRAGSIMSAAADAGGDDVRINGLSFDLEDNAGPLAEARKAAMADARHRAEDLARLSGRKLGRVLAVDDNSRPAGSGPTSGGHGGAASFGAVAADMASSVPIEAGQLDTVFRVTIVYALD